MAGERTLRVRPNLAVDRNEINTFLKILNISMQQTKGNMK
jgi:4-aminobutyrate aminotransferase-like enzyme